MKLYNGNSIEIMKTFSSESVDLIVTDPPYRITPFGSKNCNMGGMIRSELTKKGKVFENNDVNISDYAPEFYRLLKDGTHCYVMTNHVNLIEMLNTFTECGFKFIKSLIWNKENKISGRFYMSQFEYILFFRKGTGFSINNCGTSDIITIPNIKTKGEDGKNLHDTEKPIELMKILIDNSTKENQVVLDPFMGIGSTGVACKILNRDFIGIELDKTYYDIAENRINMEQKSQIANQMMLF